MLSRIGRLTDVYHVHQVTLHARTNTYKSKPIPLQAWTGLEGGTVVYMREGTTSRVMAADRPYYEFYDFYIVSPEYFGHHHALNIITHFGHHHALNIITHFGHHHALNIITHFP
jgi:hypothetical protein